MSYSRLRRQAWMLTQSQQARSPLPALMERDTDDNNPPTPPPKDARYSTAAHATMNRSADAGSAPASGSKRKRHSQDLNDTIYERRNGRLEAVGDQDAPTPQKRPRSHAGRSHYSDDDATPVQPKGLRRKKGFGNLSNMNLRHAATSTFRSQSPTRESRFQEGSLNDKVSQQPPSVFTRIARTDSGNLQQVDELMKDYHEGIATPRDSTEAYEKATIEYEKATMPARVAEITEQRKKETGRHGVFRFGKSFTNTFHPVQLWNRMWSESKEELIAKNRLEAERKAREKAEIQARYDQMKRDGHFNMQRVPFAGTNREDPVQSGDSDMVDDGYEAETRQRSESFGSRVPHSQGEAGSNVGGETVGSPDVDEAVPTTATKGRFPHLFFRTPSLSNLKDTFGRSVRSVRSHSVLSTATGRDSSASASVSPAKPELSTLKRSISRFDLKKERRLSNRVSDLESKLNKARMELKNALDDASPMPKLSSRYERFTPVGTTRRSRFVPGALATLPSERLLFPEMAAPDANTEQQSTSMTCEVRPIRGLEFRDDMMDMEEDEYQDDETVKAPREKAYPARAIELFQPSEGDIATQRPSPRSNETTNNSSSESAQVKDMDFSSASEKPSEIVQMPDQPADNAALAAKHSALEASYKAAKSKKRRSVAADERSYQPDDEAEDTESEETQVAPKKKRKSGGKTAGTQKKKSPAGKAGNNMKTSIIPVPVANSKGKGKGKKVDNFFTNGKLDDDSSDELAPTAPASVDVSVQALEPVYEDEVTTVPLKDAPSKPTAKSTPARYGRDAVRPRSTSPHKKRTESLQPVVDGVMNRARPVIPQRRSAGRSPPPQSQQRASIADGDENYIAVPGEDGVPNLPTGAKDKSDYEWPDDIF